MRPARISGADPKPLGAPPDWNEAEHGHCGGLFIRRENLAGVHFMRSAWEVETGEAALMLAGAPLNLGVQGHAHPVVQLGVGSLPVDFEPVVTARRFNDLKGRPMVRVEMLFPYVGGRRGFAEEHVDGTLADAVSTAITRIEKLARDEGWTE
jgi:hypothetical protein